MAMPNEMSADAPINIPFAPEVDAISLDPISVAVEAIPTPAPFCSAPLINWRRASRATDAAARMT